ncbi:MAG: hypothetical protein V2A66_07585 [Pseudomonadota bacterium]
MNLKGNRGNAMIEVAAMTPLAALFFLIIIQFAALFTQGVHDVASAEAEASAALREWDASHLGQGFQRMCIEKMGKVSFVHGGEPVAIGAGKLRREISAPQEVKIVSDPICADW